jgi:transcription termination factor Rho
MSKRKRGRARGRGGFRGRQGRETAVQQPREPREFLQANEPAEAVNGEALPLEPASGILEMHPNGYGFLRDPTGISLQRERTDPFVPGTLIDRYGLREGLLIHGMVQHSRKQQGPRLREITDVDGIKPEDYINVKHFDQLTPINPEQWLRLETGPQPLTTRVMDLLTPLGKGQRALIVAPPRTGKTILLQHISQAITKNYPDIKLVMLLVDERPEEVTDMRRNVKGDVIASSLDREVESHVRLSKLVVERCKRLAEMGKDVFLLMDSITRMARAFNKVVSSHRTGTGGLDIKALDIPKKLFATARAFEEGGSLTIVATALIDTGSRMDEAIFQEFKGTGNMELVLDRKLADRRVFPAIDITQSGTRREELLLDADLLHAVTLLRRTLSQMHPVEAMEQLTQKLARFKTNAEFINLIASARIAD